MPLSQRNFADVGEFAYSCPSSGLAFICLQYRYRMGLPRTSSEPLMSLLDAESDNLIRKARSDRNASYTRRLGKQKKEPNVRENKRKRSTPTPKT